MAKEAALFYREYTKDYVVNYNRGFSYDQQSKVFKDLDSAVGDIIGQLGTKRKGNLILDNYCRKNHFSDLEKKLEKTKIAIKKS